MNGQNENVWVLIPAYNEAPRIGRTIDALLSRKEIGGIIVVDDGSSDNTAEIARKAGAQKVITQQNGGKGAALTRAYREASPETDIFLLLDGDLGASATECIKLLPPLLRGDADMAIGLLPPDPAFALSGETGGMGFVVGLAHWGIKRKTGQSFAQPLCGQRAVRRSVLDAMQGRFAAGFGVEVALTLQAMAAGFKVVEVETAFRHHVTGGDWQDILHRGRQFIDVARVVLAPEFKQYVPQNKN